MTFVFSSFDVSNGNSHNCR